MNDVVRSIHVVAAVIVADDRLLVCRRARGEHAAGLWEFPGGKVEVGEDAATALRREIFEELGVPVRPGAQLIRSATLVGDRYIDLECRWAFLEGELPTGSNDHDQLRWATREELSSFDWCPPDRPAVELLSLGIHEPNANR